MEITAQDIKAIRTKYNLSQAAFARVLGIGEASIARYETGQQPTKANANLILAAKDPRFMQGCLERSAGALSDVAREQVEEIIISELYFNDEGDIMDMNQIYMLTLEKEVLSEQAAGVFADILRFKQSAEAEDDYAKAGMFDALLTELSYMAANITSPEYGTAVKTAELRGKLQALKAVANAVQDRVA